MVGAFFPWQQIWFRVNEGLPMGQQKSLPDMSPEPQSTDYPGGVLINELLCSCLLDGGTNCELKSNLFYNCDESNHESG